MDGEVIGLLASNAVILTAVLLNTFRIGKMSNNGGYLRCPFYRGHIENAKKQRQK